MKDHESYEIIMGQLCHEIDQIAENIKKNQSMTSQDLDRLDKMVHTKKGLLTCKAMEEADEYEGVSGYRGRAANGRYVSRAEENNQNGSSYAEGYERGYSEAMSHMNTGYSQAYPEVPRFYMPRR